MILKYGIIIVMVLLLGCTATQKNNAITVVDAKAEQAKALGYYTVQPQETVYFIAWRLNMDYHDLAAYNNLTKPYKLKVGQRLVLSVSKLKRVEIERQAQVRWAHTIPIKAWLWPVQGQVIDKFSNSTNGIDILAPRGTPVRAAAAGQVVYSGAGIRGYGNLVIIEHNAEYMTAYAYNDQILVPEGHYVQAGQTIAMVGSTGKNKVMLHFELRKAGKAIDPLKYLS